jgi:hypothetical protein
MKWLPIALFVGFLLTAVPAFAAEPAAVDLRRGSTISAGEVTPTPEMWFYEQYVQQYQDPKLAVRRKAEEESAQRRARIAARRWFGFSNLRPVAGTDPVHGDYSPGWSSGSTLYPFRWHSYHTAAVIVYPRHSTGTY